MVRGLRATRQRRAVLFSDRREIRIDLISTMGRVEPNFLDGFDHLGCEIVRLLGMGLGGIAGQVWINESSLFERSYRLNKSWTIE